MEALTVEALAEKIQALEARVAELEVRTTDAAMTRAVNRQTARLSP